MRLSHTIHEAALQAIEKDIQHFAMGPLHFGVCEYRGIDQLIVASMPCFIDFEEKRFVVWLI